MNYIEQLGKAAKASKKSIATAGTAKKNEVLEKIAENLRKNIDVILKENEKDTAMAKENGITDAMVDRALVESSPIFVQALLTSKVSSLAS